MENCQLQVILQRYEQAIVSIESAQPQCTAAQVLSVLTARDSLQDFLTKNSDQFGDRLTEQMETEEQPGEVLADPGNWFLYLSQIPELDRRLKAQGPAIARAVDLSDWRSSFQPSPAAWWWFFEPKKQIHKLDRYDWIWSSLSVMFLTGAFTFLAETASPFLRVEPDFFGSFTVISQSILTYLTAKGALTKKGQEFIENFLSTINLPKFLWQEVKLGISILLFISFFWVHNQLPRIGQYYFHKGLINYSEKDGNGNKQLISAEKNYKRALEFNPDNPHIYNWLAMVYEDLEEEKKARTNYLIAANSGSARAYNNLSRLYILEGKYVQAAIAAKNAERILNQKILNKKESDSEEKLINAIIQKNNQIEDRELRAYLLKNLGWARLKQGRLAAAKAELEQAINFKNDLGAAYCLLAEVLSQQKQEEKALTQWENCLSFAQFGNPDEEYWIPIAQERLTAGSESSNKPESE